MTHRANRRDEGTSPLPVEILEVIEHLQTDQAEGTPGVVRPVWHGGIVQGRPRWILGAADDGEERIEGRRGRLVDHGVLAGADVEVEIWGDPHRRDHEADHCEYSGPTDRGVGRGADEAEQAKQGERRTAEPHADQQDPYAGDDREMPPLLPTPPWVR